VVTGVAFAPIMRENVIPVLNSIKGLESELITVENNFFGETVTVAGLLTGSDIIDALQDKNGDFVVLPPECLNIDGLFLNDLKIEDFINTINIKVLEIGKSFQEIFELL
jgi:NifB/MoaA-like Fe-S oxidoreductase